MASTYYLPIHGCLSLLYRILILHPRRGHGSYRMRSNRYLSIHGWIQSRYGSSALYLLCGIIRKSLDKISQSVLKSELTPLCTATRSPRYRNGIRNSHVLGFQLHSRTYLASFA